MGKVDVGIVMGHILDSGITVDRIKSIGIPIEEMIETGGTITKQDIYKISRKIGCDISLLMRKKQRRSEGIKHNFEPNIFSKRVQELGWTDVCLNNVCTHASNVIRSLKRGVDIDTLHNYELVNICFMLECDPLYLRGQRKEPTVCSSVYVVPQNRKDFKKVDSGTLYRLITENVGLGSFGVDETDTPLSTLEKISVELKKYLGCSKKYAYSLLTSNIKIPKFVMNKLVAFTKSSEDMLTYKENRIPPITSKDTPEKDAVDDLTYKEDQIPPVTPEIEKEIPGVKLKTMSRFNGGSGLVSFNQNTGDSSKVVEVEIPIRRGHNTSDMAKNELCDHTEVTSDMIKEEPKKKVAKKFVTEESLRENEKPKKELRPLTKKEMDAFSDSLQKRIDMEKEPVSPSSGSSFINRLFQILDLITDYPEFAIIIRQLLAMSEDKQQKAITLLSAAFDLLS